MPNDEKFSILIVDDEKTNLDVLCRILGEQYTVYVAKSGEAALKKAASNQPDLILLDIVMPGLNGFEVIVQLKENEETRRIPVIFITGLNQADSEEKGIRLGAVDYITKPFSPSIVKARISTQLNVLRQVRLIEKICMLDPVTGISNYRHFDDRQEVEWQKAKRDRTSIGLLLLRLDGLPEAGEMDPSIDLVLRDFADGLKPIEERPTELIARIDLDEFVVLMAETDRNTVNERKKSILEGFKTLKNRYADLEFTGRLSLAIGEAVIQPKEDESVDRLMAEAERALS